MFFLKNVCISFVFDWSRLQFTPHIHQTNKQTNQNIQLKIEGSVSYYNLFGISTKLITFLILLSEFLIAQAPWLLHENFIRKYFLSLLRNSPVFSYWLPLANYSKWRKLERCIMSSATGLLQTTILILLYVIGKRVLKSKKIPLISDPESFWYQEILISETHIENGLGQEILRIFLLCPAFHYVPTWRTNF